MLKNLQTLYKKHDTSEMPERSGAFFEDKDFTESRLNGKLVEDAMAIIARYQDDSIKSIDPEDDKFFQNIKNSFYGVTNPKVEQFYKDIVQADPGIILPVIVENISDIKKTQHDDKSADEIKALENRTEMWVKEGIQTALVKWEATKQIVSERRFADMSAEEIRTFNHNKDASQETVLHEKPDFNNEYFKPKSFVERRKELAASKGIQER